MKEILVTSRLGQPASQSFFNAVLNITQFDKTVTVIQYANVSGLLGIVETLTFTLEYLCQAASLRSDSTSHYLHGSEVDPIVMEDDIK